MDTGYLFPSSGTIANRAGGSDNWTNPGNIVSDNGSVASINTNPQSHYLIASNFGFSIPPTATINSVTVTIEAQVDNVLFKQLDAQLQDNGGTLVGTNKQVSIAPASPLAVYTYSVDNWGAALTPTIINDSDFGVRFWCPTITTGTIDYVKVSVQYSMRRITVIN